MNVIQLDHFGTAGAFVPTDTQAARQANRSRRRKARACCTLVRTTRPVWATLFVIALSPAIAHAASPLVGTWKLTAADTLYPDGHREHGFGDRPEGRMMVNSEGRYVMEIYRAASTNFASGSKAGGTEAEFRDAMIRNSVHYGHVTLDPAHHHIVFDIERSVFPNWEGQHQVRDYTLMGGHLSYEVPASATGDKTVAISEWQQVSG